MTLKDRNKIAGKFLLQLKLGIKPCCGNCIKYQLGSSKFWCDSDYYWIGMKKGKVIYVFKSTEAGSSKWYRTESTKMEKRWNVTDDKLYQIFEDSHTTCIYWCPDFKRKER